MTDPVVQFVGTEWYPRSEGTVSLMLRGDKTLLIDCPPNITMLLDKLSMSPSDIDSILVTHSHVDHILGLPYLILARFYEKMGTIRDGPTDINNLTVRVNEEARPNVDHLFNGVGTEPSEIFDDDEYSIESVNGGDEFSIGSTDIRLFDTEHSIPTLGAVLSNNKRIGYTCDTVYSQQVVDQIGTCDALISEAAYSSKDKELASQLKHATANEAARLGTEVSASELYLVHESDTYTDDAIRNEAADAFDGTVIIPEQFETIPLQDYE